MDNLAIIILNYNSSSKIITQVNKLKEVIQEADPNVFILITDAQEVIGQGFTQPIVPAEISKQLKSKDITTEANNNVVIDIDENSCNKSK